MDQNVKEHLEFANKLIFVKKYDEAERVLREALTSPDGAFSPMLHLRRIELMSLLGRLPELKRIYASTETTAENTALIESCAILTEVFMNPGESGSNLARLQRHSQEHGASELVFFAMGYCAEQSGEYQRAKAFYEQCISLDPQWYPGVFGLSQVCYNLGDDQHGDQYFHQFELMAPYNVYGNFETHRRLSNEFVQLSRYDDAALAIQTLSQWWHENKGFIPPEIQIFEHLATGQILNLKGDRGGSRKSRTIAQALAEEMISGSNGDENALYFVARVLTEFGEDSLAFEAYKKVLKVAGNNPSVVQKVGSHFLGSGEFDAALELFEHAYEQHPNNPEIRFCLLVARLKKSGVNVEEYLIGRERIRQLADHGDRVEFLSLLNALNARFPEDWDVHFHLADLYLKMGHEQKAGHHYSRMFALDPKGQASRLKYAHFLMEHGEPESAMDILRSIEAPVGALNDVDAEVQWLKAVYYERKSEWSSSLEMLQPLVARDPWNITYLVHEVLCLTGARDGESAVKAAQDHWARKLTSGEETRVNWIEFSRDTAALSSQHAYQLAYARAKLQFLYMRGSEHSLRGVVKEACAFDASRGAKELLKLINTNFDHPSVYWGLGLLYKELWQLEVASMWFELTLGLGAIDDKLRGLVYLDLADSYIWRNVNLPKAVEYVKLALDFAARGGNPDHRAMMIMGHGLLRQGQVRLAQSYLDQMRGMSELFEVQYLLGLLHYRNGHPTRANEIWKPLLKFRTEQMRDYRIKQEILRYYFDKATYIPRDLSKAN
jgi:tetratricopeptide (TPR) repeat protein